jgi:hypothetical protein
MCTQGPRFDSKLVALLISICSALVINVKGNITETELNSLSTSLQLARVAGDSRYLLQWLPDTCKRLAKVAIV